MMIDPKVYTALLLTSLGAAGTSLGAFLVVLHPKMQFKRLGLFQGLAGGLMLSISVFDLFQESQEAVGTLWANVWFFAGVVFFAAVVAFIPEPDATHMVIQDDDEEDEPATGLDKLHGETAAHSTAVKTSPPPRRRAAGAADSASQLQQQQLAETDAADTSKAGGKARRRAAKRRVLMSGLITAIGIALHNFPEGVAVFLASMKSTAVGVSIACAIALHNIPEGVAVALPVYFATGSRWQGFKYAFISGLAEPAAVIVLGLLFPTDLSQTVVDCLLAAVGGIMAFLALSELLPLAIEHAGRQQAVAALFVGMALMSANLYILEHHLGHSHEHGSGSGHSHEHGSGHAHEH